MKQLLSSLANFIRIDQYSAKEFVFTLTSLGADVTYTRKNAVKQATTGIKYEPGDTINAQLNSETISIPVKKFLGRHPKQ